MLCISAHNIRYYEKEGLIKPSHVSDAGYRLYDYDDVYQLSAIMLLRDSNIAIKRIKELFASYSREGYTELLKQSYKTVTDQIEKILELQKQIEESLQTAQRSGGSRVFEYRELPPRTLKIIKSSDYKMDYSLKELFDIFVKHNIDSKQFYKEDSIYYLTDDDISYCIEDNENIYDLGSIVS